MNSFKQTIEGTIRDFDKSSAPPSVDTIAEVSKVLKIEFGPQMLSYLKEFGYLGKGSIELYGVNERQKLQSDLVTTTMNLWEYNCSCRGFVVIENRGDGIYAVCNANDEMFLSSANGHDAPEDLGMSLSAYISERLAK